MERQATRNDRTATSWIRRVGRVADVLPVPVKATGTQPLPHLDAVHPCAASATRRWCGLVAVAVADIVGTASYAGGTRRRDFLPTRGHQPADWRSRWNRLQDAAETLVPLPPIEVLKAGDGYWVVDGHNRVALARSTGQVWIDADVTELLLPSPHQRLASAHGGTN
jgi:hypothetical protein